MDISEKVTVPPDSSSRSHFQHACGRWLTVHSLLLCSSPGKGAARNTYHPATYTIVRLQCLCGGTSAVRPRVVAVVITESLSGVLSANSCIQDEPFFSFSKLKWKTQTGFGGYFKCLLNATNLCAVGLPRKKTKKNKASQFQPSNICKNSVIWQAHPPPPQSMIRCFLY